MADYASGQSGAIGGARRDRTADPLLAKQVLSQLSYGPVFRCIGQTPATMMRLRICRVERLENGGSGKS